MTIDQALKLALTKLSAKKIENPPLEAEILLSDILKKPLEFLLTHGEKPLSQSPITKYQQALKKRLKGEPIAYLTGRKEFYGLSFMVNKNVLIPRPETELLVEESIKLVAQSSQPATIIDIGTGSGCIIITLAKKLNHELRIMNNGLMAVDISAKALAVAKKNAELHGVDEKIKFIKGDLLTPFINNSLFTLSGSLIILANLPYGWKAWKNNCSLDTIGLKFEPEIALFTGKNGLKLYDKLLKQLSQLVDSRKFVPPTGNQSSISALLEFDPRQTKLIKKLLKKYFPQAKLQIKKDLAGLNRLAIIKLTLN